VQRRLVSLALEGTDRLLYHNEPIRRDGQLVGHVTSGMFGHTLGSALGLGYLANRGAPVSDDWITAGHYEVEVAAERVAARVSSRAFYDPTAERVRI
jgi:4-methylaminobutanoate oxidase (formaldehyde-forming)